jgi:hypothetical protein
MMHRSEKQRLTLGEALLLALPFLLLLLVYSLVTGKVNFYRWPPVVEMRAGFWLPVVFCSILYFYVLLNLHERRKGDWKWYREGMISAVTLIVLWCILSPVYEHNVWMAERHKVGLSHP